MTLPFPITENKRDQNHVKCNSVKTQYYLQKVFSEIYQIAFKASEIVGSGPLIINTFILLYSYLLPF